MTLTFDLETGAQYVARVVEYPPANFGDSTAIRCRFMGYCAWARVGGRGETSSLSIDPPAALLLTRRELTNNCLSATTF